MAKDGAEGVYARRLPDGRPSRSRSTTARAGPAAGHGRRAARARRRRAGAGRARRACPCSAAARPSARCARLSTPRVERREHRAAVRRRGPAARAGRGCAACAARPTGEAGRPFLLVHGLSSNARLWDGVGRRLAAAGHQVVAVDQRGHGRSEQVDDGYTTAQCAADLAALCAELGLVGDREPVVAGQSWGGNVVLTLAARARRRRRPGAGRRRLDPARRALPDLRAVLGRAGAAGPARPDRSPSSRHRFRGWLADWPPDGLDGTWPTSPRTPTARRRPAAPASTTGRSCTRCGPTTRGPLFPQVHVPVAGRRRRARRRRRTRAPVREALPLLPDATTSLYVGAHHDLHAQHPERLAADLLALAARAEAGAAMSRLVVMGSGETAPTMVRGAPRGVRGLPARARRSCWTRRSRSRPTGRAGHRDPAATSRRASAARSRSRSGRAATARRTRRSRWPCSTGRRGRSPGRAARRTRCAGGAARPCRPP